MAQLDLDRGLLSRARAQLAGGPGELEAWRLLLAVDGDLETSPLLDEILAHPYVRTGLQRSLGGPPDTARFMALSVAVALRAGVRTSLSWDQPGTRLHLPALGTYRLGAPGRIEVTVGPGEFRVRESGGSGGDTEETRIALDGTASSDRWRPLDRLWAKDGPLIDDADPYRDCFPVPVAPQLECGTFAGTGDPRLRTAGEGRLGAAQRIRPVPPHRPHPARPRQRSAARGPRAGRAGRGGGRAARGVRPGTPPHRPPGQADRPARDGGPACAGQPRRRPAGPGGRGAGRGGGRPADRPRTDRAHPAARGRTDRHRRRAGGPDVVPVGGHPWLSSRLPP
ncbi:hypothetical protein ACRAWF_25090 [Streptomyces sp. L7]